MDTPHTAQCGIGPLEGIKVLDLTTFLSGPYCTQILGDLGADIVKVEAPSGDPTRKVPPYFVGSDSVYFLSVNRNKRSIILDLKNRDDFQILKKMIANCDVVVDNYRPGVLKRLGINVQKILERYPKLIWASISGFGYDSNEGDRPAYDMIVQALSGVMSVTGEEGRPAVRLGIPAGDTIAGLYACIAINAALAARTTSSKGQWIDVSMLDCQLAMLAYLGAYALIDDKVPPRQGASHQSIPTYRSFMGKDGVEFVVTANTQMMWRGLCKTLELDELISDERFSDNVSRLRHRKDLDQLLEHAVKSRPARYWVDKLIKNKVPAALIKTVPEALAAARTANRDMIWSLISGQNSGEVEVVGQPIHWPSGNYKLRRRYPPKLNENRSSIMADWVKIN
ncbi:MAG: CoA transferase [Candidatus Cloacimonetes bacterium]|nr:CoA transferase [Candidatus Cloacimonadota bacterium]